MAAPPVPDDVAVVVLTHQGLGHLGSGLPAILDLEGLAGPSSVIVADNASTDGTADWLAARHPAVRHLRYDENLGFAEGNNQAVASTDAPWVLLLNDDTMVATDVLRVLCEAVRDMGAACAGARLTDWSGEKLDFDGGAMSWTGHGHALGVGRPVRRAGRARPTFFACGAAMLIDRRIFVDVGGFDPSYFAYYEDVDLGWRLHVAGHSVLHVPAAVVRHRGGGTASALSRDRRSRLHERNALSSVFKNYSDETLRYALPAALSLAAVRAGAPLETIGRARRMTSDTAWPPTPAAEWDGWRFIDDMVPDFDPRAARRSVQGMRCVEDGEVVAKFGRTWAPVPGNGAGWKAMRRAAVAFGLDALWGPPHLASEHSLVRRALAAWKRDGAACLLDGAKALWNWRGRGR